MICGHHDGPIAVAGLTLCTVVRKFTVARWLRASCSPTYRVDPFRCTAYMIVITSAYWTSQSQPLLSIGIKHLLREEEPYPFKDVGG